MRISLDEIRQLDRTSGNQSLVNVIWHGTQGQNLDAPFPGLTAIDGKKYQIVVDGVKYHASVTRPLIHVVHFS